MRKSRERKIRFGSGFARRWRRQGSPSPWGLAFAGKPVTAEGIDAMFAELDSVSGFFGKELLLSRAQVVWLLALLAQFDGRPAHSPMADIDFPG